jgi:excisionase family DNA binding protein
VTSIADGTRVSHHPCMESRLLITKREAAEQLGVSVRTVERLAASGRLPLVHIERLARFRPTDVEAFVQSLAGRRPPRSDSRTKDDQL